MLHPFQALRVATCVPIVGIVYYLCTFPRDFYYAISQLSAFIWSDYNYLLLTVLFLRYFRLAVNMFGLYFLSKPDEIPENPTVTSDMAHVIIPTIDPENEDFRRCVLSVLEKKPGWITLVTANQEQTARAQQALDSLPAQHHTQLAATTGPMANKRHQLAHVFRQLAANREDNKDVLVVLVDDHVWWPSTHFLSAVLAPFENPNTGIVAMHKQPERNRGNSFTHSLLNFIACLYLERHNFEIGASNAIDGSAFVVSARTCVVRASIVIRDDFINGFVDEYFFFGKCGPLNPDDDNYITRYIVRNGWNIKWQNSPEALMETSLGVTGGYAKFRGQINRWARSQWRSNPCSVFTDRSIWRRGYLWGALFFIVSFFNFALVWDPLIVYLWYRSSYVGFTLFHVACLILGSKFVKVAPFFYRNPWDICLFPCQVLFAYLHSFVKLWALLTFWDHSWGGRNLAAIGAEAAQNDDDDSDDREPRWRPRTETPSPRRKRSPTSGTPKGSGGKDVSRRSQSASTDSSRKVSSSSDSAALPYTGPENDVTSGLTSHLPANVRQRHLTQANVPEGQYNLENNANFHGTPRTVLRPSSKLRDSLVSELGTMNQPSGYLADNESLGHKHIATGPVRTRRGWPANLDSYHTYDTALDHESYHTYDPSLDCVSIHADFTTPPRTYFSPPIPAAPARNSIIFIKDSPFQSSPTPPQRGTVPSTRRAARKFIRDYPRGDDCLRTHPDGTHLTARRPSSGMRRCRSPEPHSRAVVPGRRI